MPENSAGIMACAQWLSFCLSIGWVHSDLDELERIWWEHHDERGRLKRADSSSVKKETT